MSVGVSTTVTSVWIASTPTGNLQPGKSESNCLVGQQTGALIQSHRIGYIINMLHYGLNRIRMYIYSLIYSMLPDSAKDLLVSWQTGKTLVFSRRSLQISCYLHCAVECNHVMWEGKVIPLQTRCGPEGGYRYSFHDRGTRRGWGVSGQQHAPAAIYPRERPGTHFTGGWVGPRTGPDGWKISSPPGFDPGSSSPVAQALYRLSYRTHNHVT